jgi:hypothetical protein
VKWNSINTVLAETFGRKFLKCEISEMTTVMMLYEVRTPIYTTQVGRDGAVCDVSFNNHRFLHAKLASFVVV